MKLQDKSYRKAPTPSDGLGAWPGTGPLLLERNMPSVDVLLLRRHGPVAHNDSTFCHLASFSDDVDDWDVQSHHRCPYRILSMNHKEELLWSLWVNPKP